MGFSTSFRYPETSSDININDNNYDDNDDDSRLRKSDDVSSSDFGLLNTPFYITLSSKLH